MPKCASCGAEILFFKGEKSGRPHPVDKEPNPKGSIQLVDNGKGETVARFCKPLSADDDGVALAPDDNPGRGVRYISHFATCPNAAQHRKDAR